ncbi:hypothetical protein [Simkania sp.]|uniref:hypothetical protein n=1 Tax=Simkania sp. TaxID=34094 RepID=UPI003B525963
MSSVQTSYYSPDYFKEQANQMWESELNTLDTLPNAFSQLIYIMFVMMPSKEKSIGGEMEYQDYLMDQVSQELVPLLDDIKNDFNTITSDPSNTAANEVAGANALAAAQEILYILYTNPNLSSNAQLVDGVTSALEGLFAYGTVGQDESIQLEPVTYEIVIDDQWETVQGVQLVPYSWSTPYGDGTGGGIEVESYWTGSTVGVSSSDPDPDHLSAYESELQQWTADLNEISTDFTDFSKTATSVFQFFMGEEKQMLSILDNCLQDISKGEQQAINNEITS